MVPAPAYAASRFVADGCAPWLEDPCAKRQLECFGETWPFKRPRIGPLHEVPLPWKGLADEFRKEALNKESRSIPQGNLVELLLQRRASFLHDAVVGAEQPLEWAQEWPWPKRRRLVLDDFEPSRLQEMGSDVAFPQESSSTFSWGDLRDLSVDMEKEGSCSRSSWDTCYYLCGSQEDMVLEVTGPLSTCTAIVPYRVSDHSSPLQPSRLHPHLLRSLAVPLRVAKIAMRSGCGPTLFTELALEPRSGSQQDRIIQWNKDLAIELYDPERPQEEDEQGIAPMDTL